MDVIIAKNSGFCGGVRRAIRIALGAADRHGGVAVDGPLVHNRQVVELLALHGVGRRGETVGGPAAPMLVRAHGVPPEQRERWAREREIVDATCVHVSANQRLAESAGKRGLAVVLAGNPEHAEVKAVAASAGPDCRVVSTLFDVAALDIRRPFLFMAQTTFGVGLFAEMAAVLKRRFPDCEIADTICRATHDRQLEAGRLAARADVVVVVGGRHSANTAALARAAGETGTPVVPVETAEELRPEDFRGMTTAAVISGASTPGWITQEVVNRLRPMGKTTAASLAIRLLHLLVVCRVSPALSGFGFALAAQCLLDGTLSPSSALAGGLYIFFAHTLNRRIPGDPGVRKLSLIDDFYQSRRKPLLTLAWLACGLSLGLAARHGPAVFGLYCAAVAATVFYATPSRRAPGRKRPLPRHWPMAAGWTLALAGPPALASGGLGACAAASLIFLLCLGGTMIRDLHDVASDRLMGIATLPARFGPGFPRRLAVGCLVAAMFIPLGFAAAWA